MKDAYNLQGKPEIPVGKTNGSRHSFWKTSQNIYFAVARAGSKQCSQLPLEDLGASTHDTRPNRHQ